MSRNSTRIVESTATSSKESRSVLVASLILVSPMSMLSWAEADASRSPSTADTRTNLVSIMCSSSVRSRRYARVHRAACFRSSRSIALRCCSMGFNGSSATISKAKSESHDEGSDSSRELHRFSRSSATRSAAGRGARLKANGGEPLYTPPGTAVPPSTPHPGALGWSSSKLSAGTRMALPQSAAKAAIVWVPGAPAEGTRTWRTHLASNTTTEGTPGVSGTCGGAAAAAATRFGCALVVGASVAAAPASRPHRVNIFPRSHSVR
mmetsp:Transcript_17890/g.46725  ORF Transcript_17890/g.46725 Transcript_17890/m.46725 type:complete len:265 (+) Transcript_17890:1675-2469(+)